MGEPSFVTHLPIMLRPDPSRTVIRPFSPSDPDGFAQAGHPRPQRIADRILALGGDELEHVFRQVTESLDDRHRDVDEMLLRRFNDMDGLTLDRASVERHRALLIGAYFSEEYSFEAAALFNPSISSHPDQEGAPEGGIRFAMSLRGIGEGHVSSVTFRTGSWTPGGALVVDPPSPTAVAPRITKEENDGRGTVVHLACEGSRELSETVLFPTTASQRQGIEDVRLCLFTDDDGTQRRVATYTAFSGAEARCEFLEGHDYRTFEMRPMQGAAAKTKGLALFPRRIDGQYAMLGRMDNESVWLLRSDDPLAWEDGVRILSPKFPWEFVQMGNCGSPIEIDEGWLVLTHGVGTVRNYCIGACLLDRDDPSKLLARTSVPLIEPGAKERDGYVPNVVYSCGGLVQDRTLLLPFGVADNFTTFATMPIDDLLAFME